jgi:hypothetical protein
MAAVERFPDLPKIGELRSPGLPQAMLRSPAMLREHYGKGSC